MPVRISIIIPFFGKRQQYIYHFLACCEFNASINWLIITDIELIPKVAENLHIIKSDLTAFNKLAGKKLGFPVEIKNPYKLCDFKPAYGLIFEDWLENCDYWGYCDTDLILGKIEQFLSAEMINRYDIISTYKGFLSGPFCLYRNNDSIKRLFANHPDYKTIFQDPDYLGFDENMQRNSISGFSLQKIWYLLEFIFVNIISLNLRSSRIREFRYQYQWYVKRKTINDRIPSDMTEIALLKQKRGDLKVFFKELLLSDSYFKRLNRKTWRLKWENGMLKDMNYSRKIFGFHFRESKNIKGFNVDKFSGEYILTEKGIFNV